MIELMKRWLARMSRQRRAYTTFGDWKRYDVTPENMARYYSNQRYRERTAYMEGKR